MPTHAHQSLKDRIDSDPMYASIARANQKRFRRGLVLFLVAISATVVWIILRGTGRNS